MKENNVLNTKITVNLSKAKELIKSQKLPSKTKGTGKDAFDFNTGFYMAVDYTTESEKIINEIKKDLGIRNNSGHGYHTTIMYSHEHKKKLNIQTMFGGIRSDFKAPICISSIGTFDAPEGTCFIIKLKSDLLQAEWTRCMKLGASYSFPKYIPHVTLGYVNEEDAKEIKKQLNNITKKWRGYYLETKGEYLEKLG